MLPFAVGVSIRAVSISVWFTPWLRNPEHGRGVGSDNPGPLSRMRRAEVQSTHHERPCGVADFLQRAENPVDASISDATKTLHELILGQKIHHGSNPIMKWHASNAVVRKDPAGNIKLDKEKSRKKIDGMAALVNATAGVLDHSDGPSVYATRGIAVL